VAGYLDKVSLSFLVDDLRITASEKRAFLGRAVRFLVRDAGIGQILDIGTGIPTTGVHESVLQRPPAPS
jgi:S-adenosyl methyltransferase